jgi:hypothetical protein
MESPGSSAHEAAGAHLDRLLVFVILLAFFSPEKKQLVKKRGPSCSIGVGGYLLSRSAWRACMRPIICARFSSCHGCMWLLLFVVFDRAGRTMVMGPDASIVATTALIHENAPMSPTLRKEQREMCVQHVFHR